MGTPEPELLRKLMRYDAETGKLFWRKRTPDMFSNGKQTAEHTCNRWNAGYAEKEAFATNSFYGYKVGSIFGRDYRAHRVIWAIVHGSWPVDQIDHISGVRTDNRISNLRDVSNAENCRNQKMHTDNKSGHTGVFWHSRDEVWCSEIRVLGKIIHLGYFKDKADAIAARKAADVKYGFHENHGRI